MFRTRKLPVKVLDSSHLLFSDLHDSCINLRIHLARLLRFISDIGIVKLLSVDGFWLHRTNISAKANCIALEPVALLCVFLCMLCDGTV